MLSSGSAHQRGSPHLATGTEPPEPAPLTVDSPRELENLLDSDGRLFAGKEGEDNWPQREQALQRYRALLRGGTPWQARTAAAWRQAASGPVLGHAMVSMRSLRTTLSTLALRTVQELFQLNAALRVHDVGACERVLPELLKLLALSKKISVQNAARTTLAVLQSTCPTRKLVALFARHAQEKSGQVRFYVVAGLQVLLAVWGSGGAGAPAAVRDAISDACAQVLRRTLADANAPTRDAARDLWWAVHGDDAARADAVYESLDTGAQRALLRHRTTPRPAHLHAVDVAAAEFEPGPVWGGFSVRDAGVTSPVPSAGSVDPAEPAEREVSPALSALGRSPSLSAELPGESAPSTPAADSFEPSADDIVGAAPPTQIFDREAFAREAAPADNFAEKASPAQNFASGTAPEETFAEPAPLELGVGNLALPNPKPAWDPTPDPVPTLTPTPAPDTELDAVAAGNADARTLRRLMRRVQRAEPDTGELARLLDALVAGLPRMAATELAAEHAALLLQLTVERAPAAVASRADRLVQVLLAPELRASDWVSASLDAALSQLVQSADVDKPAVLGSLVAQAAALAQITPDDIPDGAEALAPERYVQVRGLAAIARLLRRHWPMPHSASRVEADAARAALSRRLYSPLSALILASLQSPLTDVRKAAVDCCLGLYHVTDPATWRLFFQQLSLPQQKLFEVYLLRQRPL